MQKQLPENKPILPYIPIMVTSIKEVLIEKWTKETEGYNPAVWRDQNDMIFRENNLPAVIGDCLNVYWTKYVHPVSNTYEALIRKIVVHPKSNWQRQFVKHILHFHDKALEEDWESWHKGVIWIVPEILTTQNMERIAKELRTF